MIAYEREIRQLRKLRQELERAVEGYEIWRRHEVLQREHEELSRKLAAGWQEDWLVREQNRDE